MTLLTRILFVLALILMRFDAMSQVTDNDVVHALLGKNYNEAHLILNSLGVWYYYHLRGNTAKGYEDAKVKVYSIANSKGSVKVYIFRLDDNMINEIIINYRHDSKEQVEDTRQVRSASDFHVGTYSTDVIFKWQK